MGLFNPDSMGELVERPRIEEYRGTALEAIFPYLENNIESMMLPKWTFIGNF